MLIGITGKAGSGKDTVADYLMARHRFSKYSMAQPLKAMLKAINVPCDTQEEKATMNPIFGVTNRYLAQTLGTEWMRKCVAEDGWIRLAEAQVKARWGNLVIPDIRYDNEAEMIVRNNGLILRVIRPGQDDIAGTHVSESGVSDDFGGWVIHNEGTFEQLFDAVDAVVRYGR